MAQKTKYFKIGVFIIFGMAIFVIAVVVFGTGKIFKKVVIMETYFDESVQGIDIGSAIKFRGVKIGEVKEIAIVHDFYPMHKTAANIEKYDLYVVVRGALDANRFSQFSIEQKHKRLDKLIYEKGLRVKLVPLGITGLSYVEFDFVDPSSNPPLEIFWTPENIYIPSAPSTIQQLSESLTRISKSLTPILENLDASVKSFPEITEKLNESLSNLKDTLANARIASSDFPKISAQLNIILNNINGVLNNEKYSIGEIFENIRLITNDLKDVASELKEYPSRIIFGDAPAKQGVER